MRTSRLLLPLVCALTLPNQAARAQTKIPVWIDADPSVERGGHEVDDGFALIQAFHSPELDIRGVSVVFGNAPLPEAWQIGKEIVERFGPLHLPIYQGAAGKDDLGKHTDASDALARVLEQEPLSILSIGPVTNVATVLRLHPELAGRILRIVVVAGRRPGQRFVASSAQREGFRDFNFELDPAAFQVLLSSRVPIVLVPWEISSKVWRTQDDLERLAHGGPETQYLVPPALDWLAWWHQNVGVDGFNPFDTLAVGYLTFQSLFHCEDVNARIEIATDDTLPEATDKKKPYLHASTGLNSPYRVTYCSEVDPSFKENLLRRLLNRSYDEGPHEGRRTVRALNPFLPSTYLFDGTRIASYEN